MNPEHAHHDGGTVPAAVPPGGDPQPEEIVSQEAMIAQMRRYRTLKRLQESQKRRAKEYLEQVKAEIEEDLRPLEEEIERVRRSMLAFLTDHNGGAKFRCPGLGTAFTQHRLSVNIEDEEAFTASLDDTERARVYDLKLDNSRAKALAQSFYEGDGQIRPGCEIEEKESLTVKLSSR